MASTRPLAIVTGASSGIGRELALCCARAGFDLVIASDEPAIGEAAAELRRLGSEVTPVQADLGTEEGVAALIAAAESTGRPVDALLANAGRGLGDAFLDQELGDILHVIDTNVTGTVCLLHAIGKTMRSRGAGRILITGSIAGYMPGSYQAVYNGSKAFLDNFAFALRDELKDTGVTVTCLIPGPTDTAFFERADMLDTPVAQGGKDEPEDVARAGFEAMMAGEADVVTGFKNKMQVAMASVMPAERVAAQHRRMAEPEDDAPKTER